MTTTSKPALAAQARQLAARVHPDGGWGYEAGTSWTEPTAFALLALNALGSLDPALLDGVNPALLDRGAAWLRRMKRPDGGWKPQASVEESTWVTALVALLPPGQLGSDRDSAAHWLLQQTPANATWVYRLRAWMLGDDPNAANAGWPWFSGTAAWVTPTCLTILALRRLKSEKAWPGIDARIRQGTDFLISRACAEGGWNHGSSRALGYDLGSYPETTGLGLVATHSVSSPVVDKAVLTAQQQWHSCRSLEGRSWLRLGLLSQGKGDPPPEQPAYPSRNTLDLSLSILADLASQGKNVFCS